MLPARLLQLHRRLPTQPPSALACWLLNHGLPRFGSPLELEDGTCIELEVLDWGFRVRVTSRRGRFVPAGSGVEHKLRIAANSEDFLKLARRQEDPDTLFFNRRLILDGDTELGLRIKNWLDGLAIPNWLQRFSFGSK